jgi:hypothetical protein
MNTQTHPHNMTKTELRKWAKALCEKWNWNAGLPEIVQELQDIGLQPDTRELDTLEKEFNEFFKNPQTSTFAVVKEFLEYNG